MKGEITSPAAKLGVAVTDSGCCNEAEDTLRFMEAELDAASEPEEESQNEGWCVWQQRVHVEVVPLEALPDDHVEGVLQEAKHMSEKRLARVVLPSGMILRVIASVLLEYCHALKPYEACLLQGVVLLTYVPEWSDCVVVKFFSLLHSDRLERGYLQCALMSSAYGPLSYALDVPVVTHKFQRLASAVIQRTGDKATNPRGFFMWLGAYQLFADDWKLIALQALAKMRTHEFNAFLKQKHRCKLLEAFDTEGILTLAYSRWRGSFKRLPTPQSKARIKRSGPMGEIIFDRCKGLQPCMRLKIVISEDFSIVCNYDVMEVHSAFVRGAVVDEDGPMPTMSLPFASSFPPDEVLEFFAKIDHGTLLTHDDDWEFSWLQLADHLQMDDVLDVAARWVWKFRGHRGDLRTFGGRWLDWLGVTRLQSMQQRRPLSVVNTVYETDLQRLFSSKNVKGVDLAQLLEHEQGRLVEIFGGMNAFLNMLQFKPNLW